MYTAYTVHMTLSVPSAETRPTFSLDLSAVSTFPTILIFTLGADLRSLLK